MIDRVLTNLLDNAIRHTAPGGRIELSLEQARGGVQVRVSDNGAGIPDALRAGLFTRASVLALSLIHILLLVTAQDFVGGLDQGVDCLLYTSACA